MINNSTKTLYVVKGCFVIGKNMSYLMIHQIKTMVNKQISAKKNFNSIPNIFLFFYPKL